MSCAPSNTNPLSTASACQRSNTRNTSQFQPHQHSPQSPCVNVAPPPQSLRNRNSGNTSNAATSPTPSSNTCSSSCPCLCSTASTDSKCPYMRRVAQARLAASIKNESSGSANRCTALVPFSPTPASSTTTTSTRVAGSPSNKTSAASSASSSSSAVPVLVRGEEFSLYRLSKSAALQAASKGIQLTLVAPNSSFPSTPSSHSLHEHDNDTSTSSNHTTTSAATAADGTSARSASITTTITTRIRTYDGETGQTNGLVVSTTKRAIIRSAL